MSTQALTVDKIKNDEFYTDYKNLELEDIISKESYRAIYEDPEKDFEIISPDFLKRVFDKDQDRFVALQKWEGVVTKIDNECFWADLYDKKIGTIEEAEFTFDDVSDQDLNLLKLGSIFYWSVGYLDRVSGQRLKSSIIKFRRLPAWTEQDIQIAKKKAGEIIKNLKIE